MSFDQDTLRKQPLQAGDKMMLGRLDCKYYLETAFSGIIQPDFL